MSKNPHLKFFSWFFLGFLVIVIFRSYFSFQIITAPDFPFAFKERLSEFSSLPFAWTTTRMGEYTAPFLFTWLPLFFFGLIGSVFSFALAERLVWFFPFLILSIFSSRYLAKAIFPENEIIKFFAPLIYVFNTYILMVVGGGQMGLAIAYSLAPFVLGIFMKLVSLGALPKQNVKCQMSNVKCSTVAGLALGIQVMFDPRIAYITMIAFGLYALFRYFFVERFNALCSMFHVLCSMSVVAGLHFYWILPLILIKAQALPMGYGSVDWISFLSFAKFEDSLSLIHPNWPENIFGKTYFMRPEFLVIPILAFASLLFTRINTNKAAARGHLDTELNLAAPRINTNNILFFALLSLVGAFLAKGSNPPLGEVYLWLFNHFPGMIMFRDPTKFYTLVALSYSFLVPYSIWQIHGWLKSKIILANLFLLFTICYLLFLIRPAWMGELGGTFKSKEVPQKYVAFKDFLASQPEFFRTFWIPRKQRFGFYSNNHPALSAQEIFGSSELPFLVEKLKEERTKEILSQAGVKYVIVPYDTEGEIFLKDRKYDHQQRLMIEEELDRLSWLKKNNCQSPPNHYNNIYYCSGIAVYEVPAPRDHLWLENSTVLHRTVEKDIVIEEEGQIQWQMINPTRYMVSVKNLRKPTTLVFSENFDPGWQAEIDGQKIASQKAYGQLNSFSIRKTGDFMILVEFTPQKYVNYGLTISGLTLLISVILFLVKLPF